MKKAIISFALLVGAACAGSAAEQETETRSLSLPATSQQTSQTSQSWGSVSNALSKAATMDYGYYIGTSGLAVTGNWGNPSFTVDDVTYHEGDYINQGSDGFLIMAGRSGTAGLVAAFVYGQDIEAGSRIDSLTFSASGSTNNTLSGTITLGLSVVDAQGNTVSGVTPITNVTFSAASSDVTSATLSWGSDGLLWQEGYKVVAVVKGLAGSATTAYMIDNISSSVTTLVPEPAAATLGLLSLVGLAARRRRK